MSVVATVARHVLRDAARGRLLRGVMLFAAGMVLAAPIAGRLSAGQDLKVVKDVGLAAIDLAGLIIAVSMGVRPVAGEVQRRTADAVLARPIRRRDVLLGRYAGVVAMLAVALGLLAAVMYVVLAATAWWAGAGLMPAPAPAVDPALLQAVFLAFVQLAVVAAAATCFSTLPGFERGPRWGRPAIAIAVASLLLVLGTTLPSVRDRDGEAVPSLRRTGLAPPPDIVRRAALSFEAVLADVYWIRAVQHYGRTRLAGGGAQDYDSLYPLLDVVTTLDPHFEAAYRLGAVFLAEPPPGGPGRPDLAVALLRKGLESAPARWQYLQDMGFVHYRWLHDVEAAAGWFERAADVPGAPWWLRPLAATTLAEGGDRDGARALWRQVRDAAGDAWMRGEAVRRMAQLDALDAVDRHQGVVDSFRERTGRPPAAWSDLMAAGAISDTPRDPTGVAYELTPPDGTVAVSRRSTLFPAPDLGSFPYRRAR
jgi:hypothetical protein